MKIVKTFFVMLYIQLIIPMLPIVLDDILDEKYHFITVTSEVVMLIFFATVQVFGCISAVLAIKMFFYSEENNLSKAWTLLKIKTVPFYIINFAICFPIGLMLTVATAGLLIIVGIVMIWHTCAFIVQSGFFGAANILTMRKKFGDNISVIHYVLQFLPVLDVISTIVLKNKCKKLEATVKPVE